MWRADLPPPTPFPGWEGGARAVWLGEVANNELVFREPFCTLIVMPGL
jgi:hypothetical protein